MNRTVFTLLALAAAATVAGAQTGGAAEATYVGAEACLECHSEIGEALAGSKHSATGSPTPASRSSAAASSGRSGGFSSATPAAPDGI